MTVFFGRAAAEEKYNKTKRNGGKAKKYENGRTA